MGFEAERQAWAEFERVIREAGPALDGLVPVAIVAAAAETSLEGEHATAEFDADTVRLRVIWPKGMEREHKLTLLRRAAAMIERGTTSMPLPGGEA